MRTTFILFAAITCASAASAWTFYNKNSVLDYDAINEYLASNVKGASPETNMEQATKWLESKASGRRNSLIKALTNFVALKSIATPKNCNRETFDILESVNLGVRDDALVYHPTRRIEKLVNHFLVKHANVCYNVYPKLIEESKAEVSSETLKFVKKLTDANRRELRSGPQGRFIMVTPKENVGCSEIRPDLEEDMFNDLRIYRPMVDLATKEEREFLDDHAKTVDKVTAKTRVKEMFNKYIYQPCIEYNEKVSEIYFHAVKFDLEVLRRTNQAEKCEDLLVNRISMSICNRLVHDRNLREHAFKRLLSSLQ